MNNVVMLILWWSYSKNLYVMVWEGERVDEPWYIYIEFGLNICVDGPWLVWTGCLTLY